MEKYEILQKEINNYEQNITDKIKETRELVEKIKNAENIFEIDITTAFNIQTIDNHLKEYLIFLLNEQSNLPFTFKKETSTGIISVFYKKTYIGYISFVKKEYYFKKKPKFYNNNINDYKKYIEETKRFLKKENKKLIKNKKTINLAEKQIKTLKESLDKEKIYQKKLYKERIKEYDEYKISMDSFAKNISSFGYKKIRN